ncbi:MAG TPA: hypothetical protein VI010_02705 [Xanthobacteraceae bacterium]
MVGQALLGKGADLQIDRPRVIALELAHCMEALEPDARIDFDVGSHAARAVDDRFLQRVPSAVINVGFAEGALGRGNRCDRFLERAVLAVASLENAGFVEVDVALDEPCGHQPAIELLGWRVGDNMFGDLDDAPARDGDVDERVLIVGPPRLPQYKIERHVGPSELCRKG